MPCGFGFCSLRPSAVFCPCLPQEGRGGRKGCCSCRWEDPSPQTPLGGSHIDRWNLLCFMVPALSPAQAGCWWANRKGEGVFTVVLLEELSQSKSPWVPNAASSPSW